MHKNTFIAHSKAVVRAATDKPRWPATIALLVIGSVYLLVSDRLELGPPWLVLLLVVLLLVPLQITRMRGAQRVTRALAFTLLGVVTGAVGTSVCLLVIRLSSKAAPTASTLFFDAGLIWLANILVFTLWYWEVDAGGPAQRRKHGHTSTDLIFPQMTLDDEHSCAWSPGFIDYLFLAFNTSTAFSPTDTLALSPRVKVLMMAQSLVSLLVVAVLAARAVNTF